MGKFMRKRIFEPLGMGDTVFHVLRVTFSAQSNFPRIANASLSLA
jgi:CubicO group peptidase (beta-lactamase class C family)